MAKLMQNYGGEVELASGAGPVPKCQALNRLLNQALMSFWPGALSVPVSLFAKLLPGTMCWERNQADSRSSSRPHNRRGHSRSPSFRDLQTRRGRGSSPPSSPPFPDVDRPLERSLGRGGEPHKGRHDIGGPPPRAERGILADVARCPEAPHAHRALRKSCENEFRGVSACNYTGRRQERRRATRQ